MIKYLEEGETLKDKSKCANIRANLKMCLLETDCCKIVSYQTVQLRLHFNLYLWYKIKCNFVHNMFILLYYSKDELPKTVL